MLAPPLLYSILKLKKFIPQCANLGIKYLIAMRVIQGLSAGVTMPAMNVLIAQWSPELERAYLSSIVFAG